MKKLLCILLITALAVPLAVIVAPVFAATEPLDEYPGGTPGDTNDPSQEHKDSCDDPTAYYDPNDPPQENKKLDDDPPPYYDPNDPSEDHKEPDDDPPAYYDPNGDGSLNALDVICVMLYLTGNTSDVTSPEAADFNSDGRVNARDVLEMMLAIAHGEA